ncbi:hypothetical protein PMAYCL1PPCAC_06892 [Pristionchus mayeri]|uniref:acetylcholinesterase n=1 Tax=Pristionchus mayeri TaxID=1317129 RepID=A0AAN4Z8X3_9BILA|nr:hypothetical protein PMAYCL1PPCAC_06892 [Pristionchus mayeri]
MILLFLLSPSVLAGGPEGEVDVQLKLGTIRGRSEPFLGHTVHSFLGVPFAEKPLGKDRFRPPRVKKPWNETMDTRKLGPACYQGRDGYSKGGSPFWGAEMWNANTPVSEDCLYMNIWAPAGAYNLTVMVWLFGGGFWYGSPSLALYDGRALAIQGNVVVVNVNYRVGAFGFLYFDHDEVPGNMGLLDQQLALYWIKDHIFNLGGDPSRIVLFGESAGASAIVAHMIAPSSKHLFTNGILQSGALDNRWAMDSPSYALSKSLGLASRVNCSLDDAGLPLSMDGIVSCMRDIPAQTLVDELWNFNIHFLEFPFVIVSKDRNFFKDKDGFEALREGDFRDDVNIMIGINHDEGNFWNIYNLAKYFDKDQQPELNRMEFHDCIETAFAVQPSLVRNAAKFVYSEPNCSTSEHISSKFYAEQVNQMVGDYFFTCDSLWMADKLTEKRNGKSGKVFIYHFAQTTSANPWPEWTGVMHGYEIEFVFGAPLVNQSAYKKEKIDREEKFSKKVIEYWTSFATNGYPRLKNSSHRELWPAYDGVKNRKWMYLKGGSHTTVMDAQKRVECDLWRHAKDLEYSLYEKSLIVSSSSTLSFFSSIILLPILFF